MKKRYRYIFSGLVSPSDPISRFRLIGGKRIKPDYPGEVAIRVQIPSDLVLEKWSSDLYSTTDDDRTIEELGYDFMLYYGDSTGWKVHNEFKGRQPHEIDYFECRKIIQERSKR